MVVKNGDFTKVETVKNRQQKKSKPFKQILDELDEIIAPDPGGQHQDSFSWRFCFHGRMSFNFKGYTFLHIFGSHGNCAWEEWPNDLPSPEIHIQIVVGFVVEVHFDAPLRWTRSLASRPWVKNSKNPSTNQNSKLFFLNTFYSQWNCEFVVFKLFKNEILTSLYPHFILWHTPPEIVRKNIEVGRESFIEWKVKSWPKNPTNLDASGAKLTSSWRLKTDDGR